MRILTQVVGVVCFWLLAAADAVVPPAPPVPDSLRVVDATNAVRRGAGLSPLCVNAALQRAALIHSDDQYDCGQLSHKSCDGTSFSERVREIERVYGPVAAAGENVARDDRDRNVARTVSNWLSSPGHRANIMSPAFANIGVGVRCRRHTDTGRGDGPCYWTQLFGKHADRPERDSTDDCALRAAASPREVR